MKLILIQTNILLSLDITSLCEAKYFTPLLLSIFQGSILSFNIAWYSLLSFRNCIQNDARRRNHENQIVYNYSGDLNNELVRYSNGQK